MAWELAQPQEHITEDLESRRVKAACAVHGARRTAAALCSRWALAAWVCEAQDTKKGAGGWKVRNPLSLACAQAHRGGLVHAVGFGSAVVTAGMYGTITMWPEAELRSIAEAAGIVLPQQPPHFVGDAGNPRITISEARPPRVLFRPPHETPPRSLLGQEPRSGRCCQCEWAPFLDRAMLQSAASGYPVIFRRRTRPSSRRRAHCQMCLGSWGETSYDSAANRALHPEVDFLPGCLQHWCCSATSRLQSAATPDSCARCLLSCAPARARLRAGAAALLHAAERGHGGVCFGERSRAARKKPPWARRRRRPRRPPVLPLARAVAQQPRGCAGADSGSCQKLPVLASPQHSPHCTVLWIAYGLPST